MEIFLKQATATSIVFPLLATGSTDRKSGATLAPGDFKICKHTGGIWDVSSPATPVPTEVGSLGLYVLPLTALELTPDDRNFPIIMVAHDVAGAEWEEQAIVIRLFLHNIDDTVVVGSGSVAYTPERVVDPDGDPIDGVNTWMNTDPDDSQIGIQARGYTDAFGLVATPFMLDPGTYYVWRQHGSFAFDNPETVTVS